MKEKCNKIIFLIQYFYQNIQSSKYDELLLLQSHKDSIKFKYIRLSAKYYGKDDDALDTLMNCHSIISDSDKTRNIISSLMQMKKRRIQLFKYFISYCFAK